MQQRTTDCNLDKIVTSNFTIPLSRTKKNLQVYCLCSIADELVSFYLGCCTDGIMGGGTPPEITEFGPKSICNATLYYYLKFPLRKSGFTCFCWLRCISSI